MLSKEEFSSRLKAAIDRKQIRQVELAEMAGVTPANMSNYVRGKAFPPIDTLVEIAEKLEISLDELCGIANRGKDFELKTYGDVAQSVMCIIRAIPLECEIETIQIKEEQQVGERENVDGYGAFPVYEEVEISVPAMVFKDGEIRAFLEDLMKMQRLLKEKTFDSKFYERWINDRLQSLSGSFTFSYLPEDIPF